MKNDNRHNPPALGRKGSLDQRSPTSTNSPKGQFEINNNNIYLTENASFQKRNCASGNSNRPRANSNAFIPNDGRKGSGNVTFGNLPINNSRTILVLGIINNHFYVISMLNQGTYKMTKINY